jgi:hypothetical protein
MMKQVLMAAAYFFILIFLWQCVKFSLVLRLEREDAATLLATWKEPHRAGIVFVDLREYSHTRLSTSLVRKFGLKSCWF